MMNRESSSCNSAKHPLSLSGLRDRTSGILLLVFIFNLYFQISRNSLI